MVKEFADAAFAMKADEVSQAPVKSQFGLHIIKLEERRTQPAPTLDSQKEQIRAELSEETVQALVQTLRDGSQGRIARPRWQAAAGRRAAAPAQPAAAGAGTAVIAPLPPCRGADFSRRFGGFRQR